jgi:DNA polymerase III alpha subunit
LRLANSIVNFVSSRLQEKIQSLFAARNIKTAVFGRRSGIALLERQLKISRTLSRRRLRRSSLRDKRINARKLTPIHELRERDARRLKIRLPAGGGDARMQARLEEILRSGRGGRCSVELHYIGGEARGTLTLDESWSVRPSRVLVDQLAALVGRDGLRFGYGFRANEGA